MSIEQALAENTAALTALTAALTVKSGASAATTPTETKPRPEPKPKPEPKAKVDRPMVNSALEVLKEAKGVEAAKKVIQEIGGVEKRADIPEGKFQAVIDGAKAAAEAEEQPEDDM